MSLPNTASRFPAFQQDSPVSGLKNPHALRIQKRESTTRFMPMFTFEQDSSSLATYQALAEALTARNIEKAKQFHQGQFPSNSEPTTRPGSVSYASPLQRTESKSLSLSRASSALLNVSTGNWSILNSGIAKRRAQAGVLNPDSLLESCASTSAPFSRSFSATATCRTAAEKLSMEETRRSNLAVSARSQSVGSEYSKKRPVALVQQPSRSDQQLSMTSGPKRAQSLNQAAMAKTSASDRRHHVSQPRQPTSLSRSESTNQRDGHVPKIDDSKQQPLKLATAAGLALTARSQSVTDAPKNSLQSRVSGAIRRVRSLALGSVRSTKLDENTPVPTPLNGRVPSCQSKEAAIHQPPPATEHQTSPLKQLHYDSAMSDDVFDTDTDEKITLRDYPSEPVPCKSSFGQSSAAAADSSDRLLLPQRCCSNPMSTSTLIRSTLV